LHEVDQPGAAGMALRAGQPSRISAVALKPSSYVILGLVRGGVTSGYAIKRFVEEQRMELFWATTFAQIYPELAHLERSGYLVGRPDPNGGRQRRSYELTDAGEHALLSWLRREHVPPRELRDEGFLRLAFADHLPRADAIDLVRRLRARSEEAEREFREVIIPKGEALGSIGVRFPVEICRMAAAYHAAIVSHLRALEESLAEEPLPARADGTPPRVDGHHL
jgi:DNA-binding PadR family transcriptional regulator